MKAVFALAFLALARAAIIEKPAIWNDQGVWWKSANPTWMNAGHPIYFNEGTTDIDYSKVKDFQPMWMRSMFEKYGLVKPEYDVDFVNFGKKIGVEDVNILNHLRGLYEEPSLVFFQDPTGKIVSYFAHEGIDKVNFMPEVKSAFSNLYGSSDALSIDFKPQELLGQYKTILPGHFFEPVKSQALTRYLSEFPVTHSHVPFKPQLKTVFDSFNVEALPNIYKKQAVPIDIERFLHDSVPLHMTHGITGYPVVDALSATSAFPFAKSGMLSGASPFVSGINAPVDASGLGFLRSGMGLASPSVKSPAYHLVKADFPFFTAAPGVDTAAASPAAGIPLMMKTVAGSPFFAIADSGSAFTPTTGLFRAAHAGSPIFAAAPGAPGSAFALVKSAACEGCLVSEHGITFAPVAGLHHAAGGIPMFKSVSPATSFEHGLSHFGAAGGIPLFRTAVPTTGLIGEHALSHFGSSPVVPTALRSAFPGAIGADSSMAFGPAGVPLVKIVNPLFAEPSFSAFSPAASHGINWKHF